MAWRRAAGHDTLPVMRLIHTADWHIGQELHGFSRRTEHEAFLDWLARQCCALAPDALLIAGDVFHHANPTNEAMDLFARFTERVLVASPALKIVAVAGNHDSPARFDALRPLVRAGVHLIGAVPRRGEAIDTAAMIVRAGDGAILAVPYLRLSDLPRGAPDDSPADRVRAFYESAWVSARAVVGASPCVVSGHLTVMGADESDSERPILIGGEHAVAPSIFPPDAAYVALGHLHRAQAFDGGRIRYAGSPFPLSAAERSYKHRVVLVDVTAGGAITTADLMVPRTVEHLRVPADGAVAPKDALALLAQTAAGLGLDASTPVEQRPFVEVQLRLAAPQPMVASQLAHDAAQSRLPVRIVRVNIAYDAGGTAAVAAGGTEAGLTAAPTPELLFAGAFALAHGGQSPSAAHMAAFRHACEGIET